MAESISVGAAVGAGFDLIRRKPLATLAWGLIMTLAFGLVLAAYAEFFVNMAGVSAAAKAGAQPSARQTSAILSMMLMCEGGVFLAFFVLIFLQTIVTTAVWRAVLHPENDRWAYLRVGMAELFVFLINIAVGFIANLVVFPLMPFLFIVGVLVALHQYIAAIIVGVLVVIAVIAGVIYLQLRFALLGPMIANDGRFHFFEAWRLSRGKVGSLFLLGLCLVGLVLVAEVVIGGLALATGAAAVGLTAGGLDKLQSFFQRSPYLIASDLWPLVTLWTIAAVPIAGSLSAIITAPWATAYRDLAPHPAEGGVAA